MITSINQSQNGTLILFSIITLRIITAANSKSVTLSIFSKNSCFFLSSGLFEFAYFLEHLFITISLITQKTSRKNNVMNAIKRISLTLIPPFSRCKISICKRQEVPAENRDWYVNAIFYVNIFLWFCQDYLIYQRYGFNTLINHVII